jgi:hypothetical protein
MFWSASSKQQENQIENGIHVNAPTMVQEVAGYCWNVGWEAFEGIPLALLREVRKLENILLSNK